MDKKKYKSLTKKKGGKKETENSISTTLKMSMFRDKGKVMLLLIADGHLPNRDSGWLSSA